MYFALFAQAWSVTNLGLTDHFAANAPPTLIKALAMTVLLRPVC
jgi:hypothetical protein